MTRETIVRVISFTILYAVAAFIGYIIYNVQRLSPFFHYVAEKNKTFVLTRTNKQANTIAALFKQKNIPASIKKEDDLSSNKFGEVTISTIHAVKGLEADIVFILGCTEQNFPCKYKWNRCFRLPLRFAR